MRRSLIQPLLLVSQRFDPFDRLICDGSIPQKSNSPLPGAADPGPQAPPPPRRTALSRLTLLAALLAGCSISPEPEPEPDGPASAPQCSTEVMLPVNLTQPEPPGPADAHADTLGSSPTPQFVRLGWPSADPSTSAGFSWRTDVDTMATVLAWGVGGDLTERTEGASFLLAQDSDGQGGFRLHEVRLCGDLEPGTTYSYRVGGEGAWSPTWRFSTPAAPGTFDSVRVAFAGDSRGAQSTWATIVELAEAHEPDLYVFSGDMVDLGVNQDEWDLWMAAGEDVFRGKGLIPAHGNHEFLARNYFGLFVLPGNEEWFSIDYGPLHIVSLNDTVRDLDDVERAQVSFLEADLAANTSAWTVATHHQSAYSACTAHGSNEVVRAAWSPVFDQYGVDVVVAGHNHIYERSHPIFEGEQAPPGQGTVYVVSGGAGAPLYQNIEDQWFNAVTAMTEHYVIGDFGPDEATFIVRDLSDNVIDQFTVPRRAR